MRKFNATVSSQLKFLSVGVLLKGNTKKREKFLTLWRVLYHEIKKKNNMLQMFKMSGGEEQD